LWFHFGEFLRLQGLSFSLGTFYSRGYLGVDIFFALSGFVISYVYYQAARNKTLSWRGFVWKRLARLYPVHLVTFLALVGYCVVRQMLHLEMTDSDRFSGFGAMLNLLLLNSFGLDARGSWNVPAWSISAEFFAYVVIFPLLCRLWRTKNSRILVVFVAAAGMFWVSHLAAAKGSFSLSHDYGFVRIIPSFTLGFLLYQFLHHKGFKVPYSGLAFCAAVLGFAMLLFVPESYLILAVPLAILLLYGLIQPGKILTGIFSNRSMVYLGRISYSLYMTHWILLIPLSASFKMGLLEHPVTYGGMALYFIAYLLAALMAAVLCYSAVERPAHRWLIKRQAFS
jgi:peptidoglycan/LPS O-acetylase OafA/YrhL